MAQDVTWLDDDVEPTVRGLVDRPATAAEILQVFAGSMRHVSGLVDGKFVGLLSFRRLDGRVWVMLSMTAPPDETWDRMSIISALRKGLKRYPEPIWVVEDDNFATAETLLKLVGLHPTGEMMGRRRVWSSEKE